MQAPNDNVHYRLVGYVLIQTMLHYSFIYLSYFLLICQMYYSIVNSDQTFLLKENSIINGPRHEKSNDLRS